MVERADGAFQRPAHVRLRAVVNYVVNIAGAEQRETIVAQRLSKVVVDHAPGRPVNAPVGRADRRRSARQSRRRSSPPWRRFHRRCGSRRNRLPLLEEQLSLARFASYSAAKIRTKLDYFCFGPNSLAHGRDCANELFPAFDVRLEMP